MPPEATTIPAPATEERARDLAYREERAREEQEDAEKAAKRGTRETREIPVAWQATCTIPNKAERDGSLESYLGGAETSDGMTAGDNGQLELAKSAALELIRRGAVGQPGYEYFVALSGRHTDDNNTTELGGEVFISIHITQPLPGVEPPPPEAGEGAPTARRDQQAWERRSEKREKYLRGLPGGDLIQAGEERERRRARGRQPSDADKGKSREQLAQEREKAREDQERQGAPLGEEHRTDPHPGGGERAKTDAEKAHEVAKAAGAHPEPTQLPAEPKKGK